MQNWIEHMWEATMEMAQEGYKQCASPCVLNLNGVVLKKYLTGCIPFPEYSDCCIRRFMLIQETNNTTTNARTTRCRNIHKKFWHRQHNTTAPGSDGPLCMDVMCYLCQAMSHYSGNCLSSTSDTYVGLRYIQIQLTMAQTINNTPATDIINLNWLLLGTCSTDSSVKKPRPC